MMKHSILALTIAFALLLLGIQTLPVSADSGGQPAEPNVATESECTFPPDRPTMGCVVTGD
jgi:hypothetical protein